MTPEENNIQQLAGRTSRYGKTANPDVALAAMCILPMLDRIGTALEHITTTLENIETHMRTC